MSRIRFDSSGNMLSVDGADIEKEKTEKKDRVKKSNKYWENQPNYEFNEKKKNNDPDFFPGFKLEKYEKIERIGWGDKKDKRAYNFNEKHSFCSNEIGTRSNPEILIKTPQKGFRQKFGFKPQFQNKVIPNEKYSDKYNDDENKDLKSSELKTSESLNFLKIEKPNIKQDSQKYEYWNFYSDGKILEPIKFSNGQTQEDVVKTIVNLIKKGNKIIFLKGVCGSGKSAIALNIARHIGKTSIVVPLKSLQKQYEEDYTGKKYIIKANGEKMKIASITGKDNHDSIIIPGVSCADQSLPENIKIVEKNLPQLNKFIENSPFNENIEVDIKDIKRMKIAPYNPYWSPILPADFDLKNIPDAKKIKYKGVNSREYIFYHRKPGCSYYDQYLSYVHADVIIFNAAKYTAELAIGRKPETEVEIIDEADEFLDNLFDEKELNLNRLHSALTSINAESVSSKKAKDKLLKLIEKMINDNQTKTIKEDVIKLEESPMEEVLMIILKNPDLESEISIDEQNYANKALEIAKTFEETIDSVFISYRKEKDNLHIGLVSSNISGKIKEIIDKNKALVFMSGTLHSENVIRNILGIKDFKIVEAETMNQGGIEIIRTGKEFNCQYSSFSSMEYSREDYFYSISECIKRAKLPILIHVNAYNDLPSEKELEKTNISNLVSSEHLIKSQIEDKNNKNIIKFRDGETKILFTTKCSRGIDFPGKSCNTILFTKYPNPNINDIFWKILKKTHPNDFWNFYKDKAKRELIQKIYRGVRSVDDHVYVLSPDKRVLEAVQELQQEMLSKKNRRI